MTYAAFLPRASEIRDPLEPRHIFAFDVDQADQPRIAITGVALDVSGSERFSVGVEVARLGTGSVHGSAVIALVSASHVRPP